MTTIGYARVSTGDQHTALQLDALRKAGCEKLFEDKASGVKTDRPGLAEAVRYARDGDTLTVWKLDRLGRSMKHLIEIVTELESKGVGFRSITENIDTTTPGGRLPSICSGRWPSSNAISFGKEPAPDYRQQRKGAGAEAGKLSSRRRSSPRPASIWLPASMFAKPPRV